VRKANSVGIIVVCLVLLWAVFPFFIETASRVLVLSVSRNGYPACPTGSACFALELRNLGPWPVRVDIVEWHFYPALIGPSIDVTWFGLGPDRQFTLIPFAGHKYEFEVKVMEGLRPPERIYATLSAQVTILYMTQFLVLHSGRR
jgi:hypothetical protein